MNKFANIALTALVATTAIVGTARGAKADSCHNLAMSAVEVATYADTYRDAERFETKMNVYMQMDCANRNNVHSSELSKEITLLRRGMNFICRKGLASGC